LGLFLSLSTKPAIRVSPKGLLLLKFFNGPPLSAPFFPMFEKGGPCQSRAGFEICTSKWPGPFSLCRVILRVLASSLWLVDLPGSTYRLFLQPAWCPSVFFPICSPPFFPGRESRSCFPLPCPRLSPGITSGGNLLPCFFRLVETSCWPLSFAAPFSFLCALAF